MSILYFHITTGGLATNLCGQDDGGGNEVS